MASVVPRQNEEFAKAIDDLCAENAVASAELQSGVESIAGAARGEFDAIRQNIQSPHNQTASTFQEVKSKMEELEKTLIQ